MELQGERSETRSQHQQLERTIATLREELELSRLNHEEHLREIRRMSDLENAELRETITQLRSRLENINA
jgi:ABC-type Na+ transport system ATPase subunit NatA